MIRRPPRSTLFSLHDALPISVLMKDAVGNPVPGVLVSWTAAGGGSVSGATTLTDARGVAAVTRTLGGTAGSQTAQASVAGLAPVTFTATALAGNAATLTLSGGDGQTG